MARTKQQWELKLIPCKGSMHHGKQRFIGMLGDMQIFVEWSLWAYVCVIVKPKSIICGLVDCFFFMTYSKLVD